MGLINIKDLDIEWGSLEGSTKNIFENLFQSVIDEFTKATLKFKKFNSAHEGYAVIKEEFDELWDEVKTNSEKNLFRNLNMKDECIQMTAMGLRFLYDICSDFFRPINKNGTVD